MLHSILGRCVALGTVRVFQMRFANAGKNCWALIADAINSVRFRKDLRMDCISCRIEPSWRQFPGSISVDGCSLDVGQALSLTSTVWETGMKKRNSPLRLTLGTRLFRRGGTERVLFEDSRFRHGASGRVGYHTRAEPSWFRWSQSEFAFFCETQGRHTAGDLVLTAVSRNVRRAA